MAALVDVQHFSKHSEGIKCISWWQVYYAGHYVIARAILEQFLPRADHLRSYRLSGKRCFKPSSNKLLKLCNIHSFVTINEIKTLYHRAL